MKYIRNFSEHTDYEAEMSKIPTPSVSYCRKENECHFMPNNVIMFKVGDLNGNTNQTVTVFYYEGESETIPITEGNKWYVHNIPSGKSLDGLKGIREITDTIISAKLKRGYTQVVFIEEASGDVKFIGCDISEAYLPRFFRGCKNIRTLDLSGWDFSNITSLEEMFRECSNLETLTVGNWDTSKITNVYSMFTDCSKLKSINCTNFRLANIKNLGQVFAFCSSLQYLDLSDWDVSKVTDMHIMFSDCLKLQTLNLSGWDVSNVTDMQDMFHNCGELKTIYMRNCSQTTIDKIKAQLETDGILNNVTIITE